MIIFCYPNHTLKDFLFNFLFLFLIFLHEEIFRKILSSFMAQVLLNAVMANLENLDRKSVV